MSICLQTVHYLSLLTLLFDGPLLPLSFFYAILKHLFAITLRDLFTMNQTPLAIILDRLGSYHTANDCLVSMAYNNAFTFYHWYSKFLDNVQEILFRTFHFIHQILKSLLRLLHNPDFCSKWQMTGRCSYGNMMVALGLCQRRQGRGQGLCYRLSMAASVSMLSSHTMMTVNMFFPKLLYAWMTMWQSYDIETNVSVSLRLRRGNCITLAR